MDRLALCALAGITSGFCLIDLVFDMLPESHAGTVKLYYATQLEGFVVVYAVPSIMASMAIILIRRLTSSPSTRDWSLCGMFALAAPYFEFVVKPAVASVAATGPDFMATMAVVRNGHILLLGLSLLTMALISTEKPAAPT
jgi:hypothetical protein